MPLISLMGNGSVNDNDQVETDERSTLIKVRTWIQVPYLVSSTYSKPNTIHLLGCSMHIGDLPTSVCTYLYNYKTHDL